MGIKLHIWGDGAIEGKDLEYGLAERMAMLSTVGRVFFFLLFFFPLFKHSCRLAR